jgi:hypothetical protein
MMDIDPTKAIEAALRIGFAEGQDQAKEEIEKLRAALSFYAEKNSWRHTISLGHPQIDGTTSAALKDSGEIARSALGEKE